MNKFWKFIGTLLLFLSIIVSFFAIVENQYVKDMPIHFISMENYAWIGRFMPYLLFWSGIVLVILGVFLIFVILFYPSVTSTLTIKKENGTLEIQKKAIEHFVLAIVTQEPFIENPSVRVKMRQHTIKVKVSGKMRKTMSVPEKQEALIDEIKTQMNTLLGAKEAIKVDVKLDDYTNETKDVTNRVE